MKKGEKKGKVPVENVPELPQVIAQKEGRTGKIR